MRGKQLDWFESALSEYYELTKGGRLGPGAEDAKQGVILNRIIRWTPEGVEYEADPRQVERLLEETGLEGANSVATPGVKMLAQQYADDEHLPETENTAYRARAARANYLAADRPDIQFAAKESCRWMSQPTKLGMEGLKRMTRYLVGRPRLVLMYPFQQASSVECYSDTDWSGCVKTRKSTSGGCLMLGAHVLKTWSATQPTVSLSSGEAEFYGVVKAAGLALGQQSILRDLGLELPVRVWTDSSAAIGICGRQGLGKLRHIATHTLWVQEKIRNGALELRKVRGEVNPADVFTKHLVGQARIEELMRLFGCHFRSGRPEGAPQLKREKATDMDVQMMGELVATDSDKLDSLPMHDSSVLPHEYSHIDIEEMFPRALVPKHVATTEEIEEEAEWFRRRPLRDSAFTTTCTTSTYAASTAAATATRSASTPASTSTPITSMRIRGRRVQPNISTFISCSTSRSARSTSASAATRRHSVTSTFRAGSGESRRREETELGARTEVGAKTEIGARG